VIGEQSQEQNRGITDTSLATIIGLLGSNDANILEPAYEVLGNVAQWISLESNVLELFPFQRLVAIVITLVPIAAIRSTHFRRKKDSNICQSSWHALGHLSRLSTETGFSKHSNTRRRSCAQASQKGSAAWQST
jgi:hypothetical protein